MKNYILPFCLTACFFFAGCGGETTQESLAATDEVIELTDEEVQILEAVEAVPVEAEPVTQENYEEALKQLEEELDDDQE